MLSHHVIRLRPGDDLKKSIQEFIKEKGINAGWIASCVGSIICLSARMANQKSSTTKEEFMEIISLDGTVSVNGVHLHICVSDSDGTCLGGHLMEGTLIYTTAEIIIAESKEMYFKRELDAETGFYELKHEH